MEIDDGKEENFFFDSQLQTSDMPNKKRLYDQLIFFFTLFFHFFWLVSWWRRNRHSLAFMTSNISVIKILKIHAINSLFLILYYIFCFIPSSALCHCLNISVEIQWVHMNLQRIKKKKCNKKNKWKYSMKHTYCIIHQNNLKLTQWAVILFCAFFKIRIF